MDSLGSFFGKGGKEMNSLGSFSEEEGKEMNSLGSFSKKKARKWIPWVLFSEKKVRKSFPWVLFSKKNLRKCIFLITCRKACPQIATRLSRNGTKWTRMISTKPGWAIGESTGVLTRSSFARPDSGGSFGCGLDGSRAAAGTAALRIPQGDRSTWRRLGRAPQMWREF